MDRRGRMGQLWAGINRYNKEYVEYYTKCTMTS